MIEVYVTKMYLFVKITQLGYVRFNVCTFYLKIKSTVKNKNSLKGALEMEGIDETRMAKCRYF